ncbi:hypothetical protein [Candidatus Uabimicrobium sp. HlEnr_7]|uniref:hypothetical protein n=1 Tax=Candidatus Uabimicrobium helgolandensis TaxID=3095367 RepID=UPI0035589F90
MKCIQESSLVVAGMSILAFVTTYFVISTFSIIYTYLGVDLSIITIIISPVVWVLLSIFSVIGIVVKDFWISRKTCAQINFVFVILIGSFLSFQMISASTPTFGFQGQLPREDNKIESSSKP